MLIKVLLADDSDAMRSVIGKLLNTIPAPSCRRGEGFRSNNSASERVEARCLADGPAHER
jgi:hypothetical protein